MVSVQIQKSLRAEPVYKGGVGVGCGEVTKPDRTVWHWLAGSCDTWRNGTIDGAHKAHHTFDNWYINYR